MILLVSAIEQGRLLTLGGDDRTAWHAAPELNAGIFDGLISNSPASFAFVDGCSASFTFSTQFIIRIVCTDEIVIRLHLTNGGYEQFDVLMIRVLEVLDIMYSRTSVSCIDRSFQGRYP